MAGLKIFDLIPGWVYAAVVVALGVHAVVAERQHNRTELALAEVKIELAESQLNREMAARIHAQEIAALTNAHAAKQQENQDAWIELQKQHQARAAADAASLDRLRKQIAVLTDRGPTDQPHAPAQVDLADRLETLGSLYAESLELLVEGRGIIERRDGEVMALKAQVENDRAACQAVTKAASL